MLKGKPSGFLISTFCILYFAFYTRAENVQVMLYASNASQSDTLGYNIVNDISSVVYNCIMNGSVRLWDSQKKDLQILPASLQKIEKSSGVTFVGCSHLFIYESWTIEKKLSSSELLGFYFSTDDKSGRTVSFGYVDAKELPGVALLNYGKRNPNGNEPLNLAQVLRCKLYYFNIVQYDGKKITETGQALELKSKKLGPLLKFIECPDIKETKTVKYAVSKTDTACNPGGTKKAAAVLDRVEDYFTANKETLYTLAGDYVPELKKKKTIDVTSMVVKETWRKENGIMDTEPDSVTFYVNKKPLKQLSKKELIDLGIIIDFKSAYDVLKEKEFSFRITEINGNEIAPEKSNSYYSAMKKYKWNSLTEYVKYD